MNLRAYYQQLKEVEAGLGERHVVVVSLATPDGGKAGVRAEVDREDAARMIVEQRARKATDEEAAEYRRELREAVQRAEEAAEAERLQVKIVSDSDLRALLERQKRG